MDDSRETAALLTLLQLPRGTVRDLAHRVEEAGSAVALLSREGIAAPTLFEHDPLARAVEQVERWTSTGIHVVTVLDRAYPVNLRDVPDRPPAIFLAGTLRAADARSVAVIGTRRPTPEGAERARELADALVSAGITVVSGLAAGIDSVAHRTALDAGGRTVAVIGSGLGIAYPPQNASLQAEIAARDAVVSQFFPGEPPSRRTFPMRNGLMAGLTLATIIVEASEFSGVRTHARFALAQRRPVFLMKDVLEHEWARALTQRSGVRVVHDAAEGAAAVAGIAAFGEHAPA